MGGYSDESVISLRSGQLILTHLNKDKYQVFEVHILNEGWYVLADDQKIPINPWLKLGAIKCAFLFSLCANCVLPHFLQCKTTPFTHKLNCTTCLVYCYSFLNRFGSYQPIPSY